MQILINTDRTVESGADLVEMVETRVGATRADETRAGAGRAAGWISHLISWWLMMTKE